MDKMKVADNFTISAKSYATQGNTILGIRKSGKSYTASKIAEEMLKDGIPILVFDPTGIWRHLRDGVNGHKGFPVVVVGGVQPDIPISLDEEKMDNIVEKVVILIRAAMQKGISVVVDLFAMNKSNWQKIVVACVRLLLKENYLYGIRHVIFEEAAEFIPQRTHPGNQVVYGLIEQMARTGRNFGIGYTLINQRAEEIAKAVFELCEMVFVHRQKGKNSLKSIREWLDHQGIPEAKEMVATIPKLANGECWVISEKGEQRIKVNQKETFHPSPEEGRVTVPHDVKVADRDSFIAIMMKEMEKANQPAASEKKNKSSVKEQMTSDADQLKEIAQLNTQVQSLLRTVAFFENDNEHLKAYKQKAENIIQSVVNRMPLAVNRIRELCDELEKLASFPPFIVPPTNTDNGGGTYSHTKLVKNPEASANGENLGAGEKIILIACTQYKNGLNRKQLTILAGYKQSARDTYISRLKRKGYLEQSGEKVVSTKAGIKALGSDYQPLPTGRDLQAYWMVRLSGGERVIFELIVNAYPKSISRDQLSQASPYKQSARDTFISRLANRELLFIPEKGMVKANEFLFGKP